MPQKNPEEKPDLQSTIDKLFKEMETVKPDSDDYAKMADQAVKLYELKEVDSKIRVSRDTLVTVGANIIVILLITRYEKEHVITTKAVQFLRDFRMS